MERIVKLVFVVLMSCLTVNAQRKVSANVIKSVVVRKL